jgi:hypothetical protein
MVGMKGMMMGNDKDDNEELKIYEEQWGNRQTIVEISQNATIAFIIPCDL